MATRKSSPNKRRSKTPRTTRAPKASTKTGTKRTAKRATAKRATAKRATAKRATAKRATTKQATAKRGATTRAAAATPAAVQYRFERAVASISVGELTPLWRRQLAIAIELGTGRRTSPDRLPKHYFDVPDYTAVWHVFEDGVHRFDYLLNTLFFAGSEEPVGIEWIQGGFEATGRDARRGLELDLPRLSWELQRAWPGPKLPPDPTPPTPKKFTPAGPGLRDLEWDSGTELV